jgi:Na+/glutamate symporter
MELLGQLIWELMKYFGEMLTIPIVAVMLIVGIVIQLIFGKRIMDRRSVDWNTTNAQNWD